MTIPTELIAAGIGLVGMPIIGLQAWTLISIVALREHFVELRKDIDGLPCRVQPPVMCGPKKSVARRILHSIAMISILIFIVSAAILVMGFRNGL